MLLNFDDTVESFEEQPVTIPVPGILKGYTPDLLVCKVAFVRIRSPAMSAVRC